MIRRPCLVAWPGGELLQRHPHRVDQRDHRLQRITPSGGTESTDSSFMDLAFSNMLPGDPQTVTVNYQNTGANTEDVYVVFPNATRTERPE